MIRTDAEYDASRKRMEEGKILLKRQEQKLADEGLGREQIRRALDPTRVFYEQVRSEVRTYERLKRGKFDELRNLDGIGPLLVGLRIALGLTQRQLAERLEVHESQVSRDERNEYFGVTVDRVNRILDALGVELKTTVKRPPGRRMAG